MRKLFIDKLCNAFLPDAEPSELASGLAPGGIDKLRERQGGLWVGGRVTGSMDDITFRPNGLNAALHARPGELRIPWRSVRAVRREFGWLTGIVVVEHARGEFRFRCFGAKTVARILSSRVTTA